MVESEQIKNNYILLLKLVKSETEENPSVIEYFNYLNEYTQKFTDSSNVYIKEELKEFLRGANRYSDEFSFTDKYYSEIRTITNEIYDILNKKILFNETTDVNLSSFKFKSNESPVFVKNITKL